MLKLEARPQPSDFWRIASPLLALVLTVWPAMDTVTSSPGAAVPQTGTPMSR